MEPLQRDYSSLVSRSTFGSSQTTIGLGTVSGRAILALGEFVVRGIDRLSRQPLFALHQPLASRSTMSLSCLSTSYYSSTTDESSSTVYGPGHLSGRAIKALGTLTLETIDEIWLRRRLEEIKIFFPHGRAVAFTEDDGKVMYDNILELSWPPVYSSVIQTTATAFIIAQIAAEEVSQIIRAVKEWKLLDLIGFLRHLLRTTFSFMKRTRSSKKSDAFPWPTLWSTVTTQFPSSRVPAPLFKALAIFLFQLSLANETCYQAARAACPFLMEILDNPRRTSLPVANYLRILVQSDRDPSQVIPLLEFEPRVRRKVWRQLTRLPEPMPARKRWVVQRKTQIDQLLSEPNLDDGERFSICCDLVELCRRSSEHIDIGINEWAFERILVYIARGGRFWDVLIDELMDSDDEDRAMVLNNALHQILPYIFLGTPETSSLAYFTDACQRFASSNSEWDEAPAPSIIFLEFLRRTTLHSNLRRVLNLESLLKILTYYGAKVTTFTLEHPRFLITEQQEGRICWEILYLPVAPTDEATEPPLTKSIPEPSIPTRHQVSFV